VWRPGRFHRYAQPETDESVHRLPPFPGGQTFPDGTEFLRGQQGTCARLRSATRVCRGDPVGRSYCVARQSRLWRVWTQWSRCCAASSWTFVALESKSKALSLWDHDRVVCLRHCVTRPVGVPESARLLPSGFIPALGARARGVRWREEEVWLQDWIECHQDATEDQWRIDRVGIVHLYLS